MERMKVRIQGVAADRSPVDFTTTYKDLREYGEDKRRIKKGRGLVTFTILECPEKPSINGKMFS